MKRAWRIVKSKYADQAFTGEGARLYGGRWSSPGHRVIYASSSLSLATLEILVHLQTSSPLPSYSVCSVDFEEEMVEDVAREDLPDTWRDYPAPALLQTIGDEWIDRASSVVLRVPSVIVPHEHNYLINPLHGDFNRLIFSEPGPFNLDRRLLEHNG